MRNRWRKACWLVAKCGGMSEAEMPTIVSSSYARRVRALLLHVVWSAFQAAEANSAGIWCNTVARGAHAASTLSDICRSGGPTWDAGPWLLADACVLCRLHTQPVHQLRAR